MSSYALQIQAALIAAYNAAPLGAVPAASDVHQIADVENGVPTTTIVMGPERVLPEEQDTPVRKRRRQFDVVHRVRPTATPPLTAAAVVDPMRIHTIARLVGNELGGLAVDIEEVGEQPRYPEKTSVVMFIQALDVIYTTARNDLTQSA